jgi:hypothetical protein
MFDITPTSVDVVLAALGEQLASRGERFELVVIGGSALLALGLVERSTRDVDIVGLHSEGNLDKAKPLPDGLAAARDLVGRDFSLEPDWLNSGPTDFLDFELPRGFFDRLARRDYGSALVVYFASRLDQVHFKLYAAVDESRPGKHEADLQALEPTEAELIAAARWTRLHDPSEGYAESLRGALGFLGVEDVDL